MIDSLPSQFANIKETTSDEHRAFRRFTGVESRTRTDVDIFVFDIGHKVDRALHLLTQLRMAGSEGTLGISHFRESGIVDERHLYLVSETTGAQLASPPAEPLGTENTVRLLTPVAETIQFVHMCGGTWNGLSLNDIRLQRSATEPLASLEVFRAIALLSDTKDLTASQALDISTFQELFAKIAGETIDLDQADARALAARLEIPQVPQPPQPIPEPSPTTGALPPNSNGAVGHFTESDRSRSPLRMTLAGAMVFALLMASAWLVLVLQPWQGVATSEPTEGTPVQLSPSAAPPVASVPAPEQIGLTRSWTTSSVRVSAATAQCSQLTLSLHQSGVGIEGPAPSPQTAGCGFVHHITFGTEDPLPSDTEFIIRGTAAYVETDVVNTIQEVRVATAGSDLLQPTDGLTVLERRGLDGNVLVLATSTADTLLVQIDSMATSVDVGPTEVEVDIADRFENLQAGQTYLVSIVSDVQGIDRQIYFMVK